MGNALFLGRGRGFNDARCGARRYIQRNGGALRVFRCTVIARGLGHFSSRQARTPRPFSVFFFATSKLKKSTKQSILKLESAAPSQLLPKDYKLGAPIDEARGATVC